MPVLAFYYNIICNINIPYSKVYNHNVNTIFSENICSAKYFNKNVVEISTFDTFVSIYVHIAYFLKPYRDPVHL